MLDSRTAGPSAAFMAVVAIILFALIVAVQWQGGAYDAEFGSHPDEPAHYVTGLMVRDYVVSGLPGNPLPFAQDYYNHYPKVALGNWPPLFYALQAAWTLLFSPARASVLVLMAVLTCVIALFVARTLAREFGVAAGVFGGLLFIAVPLVQQHSAMLMTEIPVALFSLLAVFSLGRYLETEQTRDSMLFGVFASAAILTKGSGLVLALVPPIAMLASGKIGLVRNRNLWYAVAIVAVLAGPWTWAFRETARAGWEHPSFSTEYMRQAAVGFPMTLFSSASMVISLFAIAGVLMMLAEVRRGRAPRRWAALAALLPAVLIFHSMVPASMDRRHIVQALPVWVMFAVAGIVMTQRRLAHKAPRWAWIPAGAGIAGLLLTAWPLATKRGSGFSAVVREVVNRPENARARFLVSSDATGEGMFIAETAMLEKRPGHVIRRASKLLADQEWHGGNYQPSVEAPADLIALLEKDKVRFVVVDSTISASLLQPHHELLQSVVKNHPDKFARRGVYPLTRGYPRESRRLFPEGIAVYELQGDATPRTAHTAGGGR